MKAKAPPRFWILAAVVLILWLLSPTLYGWLNVRPPERGLFGDSYGALNALFSGLAFAGLYYSIRMQQGQMADQEKQIADSLAAMNRQSDLFRDQLQTMQAALDFEKRKHAEASEPSFEWKLLEASDNERTYLITNKGGRYRHSTQRIAGDLTGFSISKTLIDHQETAMVKVTSDRSFQLHATLQLNYYNHAGKAYLLEYRFSKDEPGRVEEC